MQNKNNIDFLSHNKDSWNKQALAQNEWSRPVSSELIAEAKKGNWEIHLTPQPLDKTWLGNVKGKHILCLASAGGQQAPVLAALGAIVTVLDLSEEQLNQDKLVAERDGLQLETVQGDMCDLSVFKNETFDIIFHPISNHYVPDVNPVWNECYRVLKKGGVLLASFYNPVLFIGDKDPKFVAQGVIFPKYKIPYSDIKDLDEEEIKRKLDVGEALVFGHSLSDLIGGQISAGFSITGFIEDMQTYPRFLVDKVIPTFLATRAIK